MVHSGYQMDRFPDAPNAYDYYDGIYGKLFWECPGFKGGILVGESVEFPTKDPRVSKKRYYDNMEDGNPTGIPTAKLQGCQKADNDRLINLVRFIENCVTTTIHVKQWNQCRWQIRNAADPEILLEIFQKMLAIGQAEMENAEQTIPLVEADSRLGWEPSMEYICDKAHLEWKLRQVRQVLQMELPRYMAGVQQTRNWEMQV